MTALNTQPNLPDPDGFYASLIDAHRDLSTSQSHAMNAALVLLLANHIGDPVAIRQALHAARESVTHDTSAIGEANTTA